MAEKLKFVIRTVEFSWLEVEVYDGTECMCHVATCRAVQTLVHEPNFFFNFHHFLGYLDLMARFHKWVGRLSVQSPYSWGWMQPSPTHYPGFIRRCRLGKHKNFKRRTYGENEWTHE